MRAWWTAVLASAALLAPGSAAAKESALDLLAAAKELAKKDDVPGASVKFGDALAAAQKQNDLVLEQTVAEEVLGFLARTGKKDGKRRGAAAAVLGRLDAKRCGAFVSAPLLAADLLLLATAAGDGQGVKEAAAALAPHARNAKSGAAIQASAEYGAAMKEILEGDPAKAAVPLKSVLDRAVAEGWTDLAFGAGTELAALRLKTGDAAGAAAALGDAAALVTPKIERRYLNLLNDMVEGRLKGAPEAVLKPLHDAMEYLKKDDPGVPAGPAGKGADGASGARKASPLGTVLADLKARRIASVSRTKDGFEVRLEWDPKTPKPLPRRPGVHHLSEGGLTLAFADWAVAVRQADATGNDAPPGEDAEPAPWRAWYRLARGETWTLAKDGSVSFSR